jgi:hypothetical protein
VVDEAEVLDRWVCAVESVSVSLRGDGYSRGRGLNVVVDHDLGLEVDCGLCGDRRGGRVVVESENVRDL